MAKAAAVRMNDFDLSNANHLTLLLFWALGFFSVGFTRTIILLSKHFDKRIAATEFARETRDRQTALENRLTVIATQIRGQFKLISERLSRIEKQLELRDAE